MELAMDEDEDARSQRDEMTALDNILNDEYPNENSARTRTKWFCYQDSKVGLITGELLVLATLPTDGLQVEVDGREMLEGKLKCRGDSFLVKHLPPLSLRFRLPKDYPSKSSPEFTLECPWISGSQINLIHQNLNCLWQDNAGSEIIYLWFSYLQQNLLEMLDITNRLDITQVVCKSLLENEQQQKEEEKRRLDQERGKRDRNRKTNDDTDQEAVEAENIKKSKQGRGRPNSSSKDETRGNDGRANRSLHITQAQMATLEVIDSAKQSDEIVKLEETEKGTNASPSNIMASLRGHIVRLSEKRNFGFITPAGSKGTGDYFFHIANVVSGTTIKRGSKVYFDVEMSPRKDQPQAVNVRKSLHFQRDPKKEKPPVPPTKEVDVAQAEPSERLTRDHEVAASVEDKESSGASQEKWSTLVRELVELLKDFNFREEEKHFGKTLFSCGVCFENKIGTNCLKLKRCGHVFCRDCMHHYFRVRIEEGQINSLNCPDCQEEALPNEVKCLVSKAQYDNYESRLLQTSLDTMDDVLHCPRIHCQTAVIIDRETGSGCCPNQHCRMVFCIYCKATFHGMEPCRINSKEQKALLQQYLNASNNDKIRLEKRYGKKQLQVMVDEMMSEACKKENSQPCPRCGAPIQKSGGCNKMTCDRCNTNFCYRCGSRLPRENPYSHFNDASTECFNRLFEGLVEGEEDPDWFEPVLRDEGDEGDPLGFLL